MSYDKRLDLVMRALLTEWKEPQTQDSPLALAPVEPTPEMIVAGQDAHDGCVSEGFSSDVDGNRYDYTSISPDAPYTVYQAMIGAAPKAERIRIKPTHEAADAFWKRWEEIGATGKHGYYESTWSAINAALAHGVRLGEDE